MVPSIQTLAAGFKLFFLSFNDLQRLIVITLVCTIFTSYLGTLRSGVVADFQACPIGCNKSIKSMINSPIYLYLGTSGEC